MSKRKSKLLARIFAHNDIHNMFERWTAAVNQNPDGFRKSATSRKRKLAQGRAYISPYEQLAAKVYGEPIKPETSKRGTAKRKARAIANAKVSESRPTKYMHSAARRRLHPESKPRPMTCFPLAA